MNEAASLAALAACLAVAVTRPRRAPDWAVASACALALVAAGVLPLAGARRALHDLGPTVGFLAALLVLAFGCAREGLFVALGDLMARGSRGRRGRLLAMVFGVAAATTAVLSLDATVLLLTPVVLATAARLRVSPRPHVYACAHLANSASLLLPVSNLTNLLAFEASGLSFVHFAALMALPWLGALAVEWVALQRAFASELAGPPAPAPLAGREGERPRLPRLPSAVLAITLAGFAASSLIGLAPVWIAAAGALALVLHNRPRPSELVAAAQPGFLVFVLALGVVVRAAGVHGLSHAIDLLIPHAGGWPGLLAVAGLSAAAANLLNNLPATLILIPVVAALGHGAVLAMLIGVGVGPNLTYAGSLATLLWRRVLHAHDEEAGLGRFLRLGVATVPAILVVSTGALWLALRLG